MSPSPPVSRKRPQLSSDHQQAEETPPGSTERLDPGGGGEGGGGPGGSTRGRTGGTASSNAMSSQPQNTNKQSRTSDGGAAESEPNRPVLEPTHSSGAPGEGHGDVFQDAKRFAKMEHTQSNTIDHFAQLNRQHGQGPIPSTASGTSRSETTTDTTDMDTQPSHTSFDYYSTHSKTRSHRSQSERGSCHSPASSAAGGSKDLPFGAKGVYKASVKLAKGDITLDPETKARIMEEEGQPMPEDDLGNAEKVDSMYDEEGIGQHNVDLDALLAQCADEPIHIPGAIQGHGALVVLDFQTHRIRIVSTNFGILIGEHSSKSILETPFEDLLAPHSATQWRRTLKGLRTAETGCILTIGLDFKVMGKNGSEQNLPKTRHFYCTIHQTLRNPNKILIDCEPREPYMGDLVYSTPDHDPNQLFFYMQSLVHRFSAAQSREALLELAVQAVSEVTDYDRVMMYYFDADWHGMVLAEEIREDVKSTCESYLGLHFPASDIPKQARELYLLNKIRVLANRDAKVASFIGAPSEPDIPLDLSYSTLRAISPIHLKYIANMKSMATMSIAIMVSGRLWGLIACHKVQPHLVPYHVRSTCLYISSLLSTSIENLEYSQREKQRRLIISLAAMRKLWEAEAMGIHGSETRTVSGYTGDTGEGQSLGSEHADMGLINQKLNQQQPNWSLGMTDMNQESEDMAPPHPRAMSTPVLNVADFEEFLATVVPDIMAWTQADYAIAYYNCKLLTYSCPADSSDCIQRYVQYMSDKPQTRVFVSASLKEDLPGFTPSVLMAGVVHTPMSEGGADYIACFGVQQLVNVKWAGGKDKVVTFNPRSDAVEPRNSFAEWKELVSDRSKPWEQPLCIDSDLQATLQAIITNALSSWRNHLLRMAHFEAMDRNARLVLEQKMKKEAEWRKNMLLNNVSHELRTPLHTIKAALGLLTEDNKVETEQRELLNEASQANEDLTRLIDHLMKYTDLESSTSFSVPHTASNSASTPDNETSTVSTSRKQARTSKMGRFNPSTALLALAADIQKQNRNSIKERRKGWPTLDVRIDEGDVPGELKGFEEGWKTVAEGLISNAVKWSPDNDIVVIECRRWRSDTFPAKKENVTSPAQHATTSQQHPSASSSGGGGNNGTTSPHQTSSVSGSSTNEASTSTTNNTTMDATSDDLASNPYDRWPSPDITAASANRRQVQEGWSHKVIVELVVRDNGPGIAQSKRHLLFNHFEALDATLHRNHRSGLGLGLSLVKKYTETMGGVVFFTSTSEEDLQNRQQQQVASPATTTTSGSHADLSGHPQSSSHSNSNSNSNSNNSEEMAKEDKRDTVSTTSTGMTSYSSSATSTGAGGGRNSTGSTFVCQLPFIEITEQEKHDGEAQRLEEWDKDPAFKQMMKLLPKVAADQQKRSISEQAVANAQRAAVAQQQHHHHAHHMSAHQPQIHQHHLQHSTLSASRESSATDGYTAVSRSSRSTRSDRRSDGAHTHSTNDSLAPSMSRSQKNSVPSDAGNPTTNAPTAGNRPPAGPSSAGSASLPAGGSPMMGSFQPAQFFARLPPTAPNSATTGSTANSVTSPYMSNANAMGTGGGGTASSHSTSAHQPTNNSSSGMQNTAHNNPGIPIMELHPKRSSRSSQKSGGSGGSLHGQELPGRSGSISGVTDGTAMSMSSTGLGDDMSMHSTSSAGASSANVLKTPSMSRGTLPTALTPRSESTKVKNVTGKCLIAEDNLINQNLLKRQLQRRGYSVLTADDGFQAVKVWEQHRTEIDIILMDLAMPNMDGFDATEIILKNITKNGYRRIPIIAVTAQAFAGNQEICFARGMDGYISKPVDIKLLIQLMEEQHSRYKKQWEAITEEASNPIADPTAA